ncbi:DNA translocase FtsK [Rickettsiales endosymbiont of Stachyamoeba lipophora]|nr:DNA translocase FtsK [Rickettsiales endosymbiont of Stachyamoeba lipophora]AZL15250.1 DNA translocase FtsK [Rickettsiales endosymbiont of Stachyamoeba lipophora]
MNLLSKLQFKKILLSMSLLSVGLMFFTSIITYDPADPSFSHATTIDKYHNFLGKVGAHLADLILQPFGYSSFLIPLVIVTYSLHLLKNTQPKFIKFRLLLLPITLTIVCVAFSFLPIIEKFDIISGGGWVGWYVKSKFATIIYQYQKFILPALWIIGVGLFFAIISLNPLKFIKFIINLIQIITRLNFKFKRNKNAALADDENSELSDFNDDYQLEDDIIFKNDEEHTLAKFTDKVKTKLTKTKIKSPIEEEILNKRYILPDIDLLAKAGKKVVVISKVFLDQQLERLSGVLNDFGIKGDMIDVKPGPVVTLYELEPAAGTKSSRIIGLADDISRSMSALSARIAVVPGKNLIGIELPNKEREVVLLREILEQDSFKNSTSKLPLALGKNIGGEAVIADLARMPHLLVAGTTGSGKSVAINTMILSLLYKLTPEQCRFIMIDPKMLELSVYDGIPHLLSPVVTEPGKAVVALKWVVREMENRYKLMSSIGVRNIDGFNEKIINAKRQGLKLTRSLQTGFDMETGKPLYEKYEIDDNALPYIVVIVDEMADLMLVAGKDIEASIQRLAQMARAAGIHIVMATQRPSVDVITGVIKANFPTRISFQVTSKIDSRTILGEQGAEQLLGMGDMLYMAGGSKITRVHGPFVSDQEVEKVVSLLKTQGEPNYIDDITKEQNTEDNFGDFGGEGGDSLYSQAVQIILRDKKASTSYIQRCLKIGYNRAANIIEQMEREGIISAANHVGKREILLNSDNE